MKPGSSEHTTAGAPHTVSQKEFQLEPRNLTVLQGSDASFNATVNQTGVPMTWITGKTSVVTVSAEGNIKSVGERYSARFCSINPRCVEFTIHNVTCSDAGTITCVALGHRSQTAELYVQESGTVNIVGGNVTVQQDQQVEFQCVTSAWFPKPTITWTRNSEPVNSGLYNTTNVPDGETFNSTSVLNFQAVSNTMVECLATVPALPNPLSSSVFLVVVPKPPDWTVLIAVVCSIGGFALLVLLIIGIIYCYKHRKEKQRNYQDEMSRRVRTQSETSAVHAPGKRQGQMNAGYVPDGQTSVAPSEITDSGFSQANGSHIFEMPDVVSSNQTENDYKSAYNTVDESGFRKHRHVTIV
ncbi:immunoglobulin superfamily member 5 [Symphorus nematophorus]